MKKTILIILALCTGMVLSAQVGINTTTPDASSALDITSKNNDKGLLIPRVALTAINVASPITSPANSLLVYNTATVGAAPNNVTPGYYYWDSTSTKWIRLKSGTDTVVNLYTGDGALTGNRSVTMGSNSLNFDANTLYIDPTADRVGVGTASPTEKLDVAGNVKFSGALMPNNTAGSDGQVLRSNGANAAPVWGREGSTFANKLLNEKIIVRATGGTDAPIPTTLPPNRVRLPKVIDIENGYTDTGGIFRVTTAGLYYYRATLVFEINTSGSIGTFNGNMLHFGGYLGYFDNSLNIYYPAAKYSMPIFGGCKISGKTNIFKVYLNDIEFLLPGERLFAQYFSSASVNYVGGGKLRHDLSEFVIYKL